MKRFLIIKFYYSYILKYIHVLRNKKKCFYILFFELSNIKKYVNKEVVQSIQKFTYILLFNDDIFIVYKY